ncbi:MAG TPA: hypothetical protein VK457_05360 [Chloroflexota bacterium]|nr:hypothetical protein [Chloroflexota bacterium]
MTRSRTRFLWPAAVLALTLAACEGGAAPASSSVPSSAAAKPASAAPASASASPNSAPASAAAKPSAAASASALASAKPAAAPSSPAPTPTTLPVVDANTTKLPLAHIDIPPAKGKTGSFDIFDTDQAAHLLYVADRAGGGVSIFDVSTPTAKWVKTVETPKNANGVTVAKNVNKVFAGLNEGVVAVIDINPSSPTVNTVVATINTGGKSNANEEDYDPNTKKLFIENKDDGFLHIIDATTNQIVKKIDGLTQPGLEQPRYNPVDKMMYMTSGPSNLIYQFDPSTNELVKKIDVVEPCSPQGLAINPSTNQALLGCGNQKDQFTAIWDFKTSKVIAKYDQVGAGDQAIYSPKADRYFFAAGNYYRGGQLGIFDGKTGKFITNVPTARGSHSVGFDETNNIVYTGDQLPNDAGLWSFPLPNK